MSAFDDLTEFATMEYHQAISTPFELCNTCGKTITDDEITRGRYIAEYPQGKRHPGCQSIYAQAPAITEGKLPAGSCCDECRLSPPYGFTDGTRSWCRRCYAKKR